MALLKLEKISKSNAETPIISDVSVEIERGDMFGLLGASVSGKTTLMRIFAGMEKPAAGRVFFDNKEITEWATEERKFEIIAENYSFAPQLNVFETVAAKFNAHSPGEAAIGNKVSEILETVKLTAIAKRRLATLSAGERQRAAIAQAIASEAKILLFDEPLSNVEPNLREKILTALHKSLKKSGSAAIYVTQNQNEALAVCDKIGVIVDGEIRQIGTPQELYQLPKSRAVAEFLGRNNIIEASFINQNSNNYQEFQSVSGNHRIFADSDTSAEAINQNVFLAIRPENLSMTFGAAFPEDNLIKATITAVNYLGATTRITLDCNGLKLEALVLRLIGLQIGDVCLVGLPPNRISILRS